MERCSSVGDDGAPFGLESDYASLRKPDKNDRDLFQQHLANVLIKAMGETHVPTSQSRCTRSTATLCRVHVRPSAFPVEATVTVDNKGQFEEDDLLRTRRQRDPSHHRSGGAPEVHCQPMGSVSGLAAVLEVVTW